MGEEILNVVYGGKAEPYSIKVIKGQKGAIGFEIKQYGSDPHEMVASVKDMMDLLEETFLGPRPCTCPTCSPMNSRQEED